MPESGATSGTVVPTAPRCIHCGDTLHWLGAGWGHDRDNMASCIPEYERTGIAVTARPADAPTLAAMPLTDDEARELSRAAKQATSWTERRNTLIREAFKRGAGIREIAKAVGLSPATVHTMLHGRKR